jgi:DNA-binding NarL/FixJ family response regulator
MITAMTEPAAVIRILTVDDHPIMRDGINGLIDNQPDLKLIAEASSGREAIEQFRLHRPDVTLMDLQMPDMTGMEAILAIRAEFPSARIVVLTTFNGDVLAQKALKAGAAAYVLKNEVRKELLEIIRAVNRGLKRVTAKVAMEIAHHTGEPLLTGRETEVLSLAATGLSNKRIATKLLINEDTAKGHMKNILAKLNANDRTHAVTLALKRGIIEL